MLMTSETVWPAAAAPISCFRHAESSAVVSKETCPILCGSPTIAVSQLPLWSCRSHDNPHLCHCAPASWAKTDFHGKTISCSAAKTHR